MQRARLWLSLSVLCVPAACLPAVAAPSGAAAASWQFEATPYIWGAGISGDVQAGTLPAGGVESSFSDILHVLDLGVMAGFEARHERYGLLFDGLYIKLSDSAAAPRAAFGDVSADLTEQVYTLAGTCRVRDGRTAVDIVFGARYVDLSTELGLSGGLGSGRQANVDHSWWDGLVGARVQHRFGEHWRVSGYADVGTGGSNVSWQLIAQGGYAFNGTVALKFGYRWLSEDYATADFRYNMDTAGPFLGAGFSF